VVKIKLKIIAGHSIDDLRETSKKANVCDVLVIKRGQHENLLDTVLDGMPS
jgi:hypothetical protein